MLPEDGKLDELLSARMDEALDDSELASVERALTEDEGARSRLDSLHHVQNDLKAHFGRVRKGVGVASLGSGFAAKVIAAAQEEVRKQGEVEHYVLGTTLDSIPDEAEEAPISTSQAEGAVAKQADEGWGRLAIVALALAAGLLLFVTLPGLIGPDNGSVTVVEGEGNDPIDSTESTDLANNTSTENPFPTAGSPDDLEQAIPFEDGTEYVGDMEFPQIVYLALIEVEISAEAAEANLLGRLLKNAGIDGVEPIVADEPIRKAIDDARMIVTEDSDDFGDAQIFFIRAPAVDIGTVANQMYFNLKDFPHFGMGLGFDVPQVNLLKKIVGSTGKRFAINQKFAAPLAVATNAKKASEFEYRAPKYISSEQRQKATPMPWDALQRPGEVPENINTLLFVRVAG